MAKLIPTTCLILLQVSHGVVDLIYIQGRHEASGSLTEDQVHGNAGTGNEVELSNGVKEDHGKRDGRRQGWHGKGFYSAENRSGTLGYSGSPISLVCSRREALPDCEYISVRLLATDSSFSYFSQEFDYQKLINQFLSFSFTPKFSRVLRLIA
jgi:hypothetical protein